MKYSTSRLAHPLLNKPLRPIFDAHGHGRIWFECVIRAVLKTEIFAKSTMHLAASPRARETRHWCRGLAAHEHPMMLQSWPMLDSICHMRLQDGLQ